MVLVNVLLLEQMKKQTVKTFTLKSKQKTMYIAKLLLWCFGERVSNFTELSAKCEERILCGDEEDDDNGDDDDDYNDDFVHSVSEVFR